MDPLDPTCSPAEHAGPKPLSTILNHAAIEQAARVCRALGEPARLRLMARLAGGERCVSELAQIEGDELSTISQRLRVLRAENIVVRRRRGKHINYALADGHMTDLLSIVLAHASEPLQSRTDDIQEAFDQSQQTGTTLK